MKLGEAVSAWRKVNGVSVRALARIVGVDHCAIHRLEHGRDIRCRALALIFCWLLDK